jgi:hypothetical protein
MYFLIAIILGYCTRSIISDYDRLLLNNGLRGTIKLNDGFIGWYTSLQLNDKDRIKYLVKMRELDVIIHVDNQYLCEDRLVDLIGYDYSFFYYQFNTIPSIITVDSLDPNVVRNALGMLLPRYNKNIYVIFNNDEGIYYKANHTTYIFSNITVSDPIGSDQTTFSEKIENFSNLKAMDNLKNTTVKYYHHEFSMTSNMLNVLLKDLSSYYIKLKIIDLYVDIFPSFVKVYKDIEDKYYTCLAIYRDKCISQWKEHINILKDYLQTFSGYHSLNITNSISLLHDHKVITASTRKKTLNRLSTTQEDLRLVNPELVGTSNDKFCFNGVCEIYFETNKDTQSLIVNPNGAVENPDINPGSMVKYVNNSIEFIFHNETILYNSESFLGNVTIHSFQGVLVNETILNFPHCEVRFVEYEIGYVFDYTSNKTNAGNEIITKSFNNVTEKIIIAESNKYSEVIGNNFVLNEIFYTTADIADNNPDMPEIIYNDDECSSLEYIILGENDIIAKFTLFRPTCTIVFKKLLSRNYKITEIDCFTADVYEYKSIFLHDTEQQ